MFDFDFGPKRGFRSAHLIDAQRDVNVVERAEGFFFFFFFDHYFFFLNV